MCEGEEKGHYQLVGIARKNGDWEGSDLKTKGLQGKGQGSASERLRIDDVYEEEAYSTMAQLYFYRLQNLDNVLEMLVVEIHYNILQNTEDLKEIESLWVKFANF